MLDEARAPNVKQYLRGLRNYYVLSEFIKVASAIIGLRYHRETLQLLQHVAGSCCRLYADQIREAQLHVE